MLIRHQGLMYVVDDLSDALHHRLSIDKDNVTHSNMTIEPSRSMTYRQSVPASSSQSWIHDVYISFRGNDTRNTFVSHLYSALWQQGIHVYMDDKNLPQGDAIGPSLMKAIEESQISIIVLSENYAGSSWCLDELAYIMKCMEERGKLVMPIFYHVKPSEVNYQRGKFGEAFAIHEFKNTKKVESWRKALKDVSSLSGWAANGNESVFIKEFVDAISRKLYSLTSTVNRDLIGIEARLYSLTSSVNRDLIGIEARVQDLHSKLLNGSGGVLMIGIWGVDGSGKTTLASSLYDRIFNDFNGCCYLENIREQSSKYGLENLQQKILSRVLKQEVEVGRVEIGRHMIKSRLCHRKVLIVLDDVDHLDQLNALAGSHDWFGEGSRIIITTKGYHLLHAHKVNVIYSMELLNDDEAIQLFCKHANGDYRHIKEYELILKDVVSYARGLPLAIRFLGLFVCDNGMNEWGSLVARLNEIPDTNIVEKLKNIFDGPTTMDNKLFPYIPTPSSQLWNYDVYVNFNEEDICKTFVDNLCSALLKHGIHIYKDDSKLPRSESVGPSHLKAIQESQIVIIIFSKNYADSTWCLEELAHIMNWMDETGQIVMPIFYHVDPSEVIEQKQEYGETFAKYEMENSNQVESWRKALVDAANLSGWNAREKDESNFIADIIDIVTHRLPSSTLPSDSIPTSYSQCWNHDIFLSFIGEHGCKTFVDHIYSSLLQHGIHTYKPNETLSHDDLISPTLLKAIEESRIAIIIFSKNYARSLRCLDELAYIMKCVDTRDQKVMPIFYDVDPSDVQEQNGAFGKAFQKQELENMTKSESWRKAFVDACDHSGWSLKHIANMHEAKYIKDIVDTISHTLFSIISNANKDLIGMGPRLKGLKSTLAIGSGGVHMVGVLGIAGGGKTTLASSVYMDVSRQFEGRCFVGNIRVESRKYGLKRLQQKILSTILKKEVEVPNDVEGRSMIKSMLHDRNVLIVLDDVNDLDQLEALAGSPYWFGGGSRIIITSRDQSLLSGKVDVIYGVILLSRDEAIQLFRRHAFSKYQVIEDYEMLSLDVVSYIGGLPLALKVVGSFLYGKNKNEWISFLANLKEIQNPSFTDMLKISYNGLHHEEKELFLDIVCFFRHWPKDEALMILDACYLHPRIGVLIRNALISVTEGWFDMHDIVQEMGHEIVRGENTENPEKYSRVWQEEDVLVICASDAMEHNEIQALHAPYHDAPPNLLKVVANMKNLRLLSVRQHAKELVEEPIFLSNRLRWISWENYPASSFPTGFEPTMLFGLILKNGLQKELWKGYKDLPRLKLLDLHGSKNLIRIPEFTGLPNLEGLVLSGCSSLEKIDPSVGCHEKLVYLNLDGCEKLEMFPPIITMQKLETLILSRCSQLQKFPEIQQTMDGLQHIYLDYSGIEVVPSSIGQYCINLVSLSLIGCGRLKNIEGNFQLLQRRCLILVDPRRSSIDAQHT